MNFTGYDLSFLGEPFHKEEIHAAIKSMPSDKALDRMALPKLLYGLLAYNQARAYGYDLFLLRSPCGKFTEQKLWLCKL